MQLKGLSLCSNPDAVHFASVIRGLNMKSSKGYFTYFQMGSGFGAGMGGPGGMNLGGMDFSQMLNNPALMNMVRYLKNITIFYIFMT